MTVKAIKISVIIVNYNVKDFLEQCLESVTRSLNDVPSEIIVVDNNSIDGSVQMLKKRFPKIILIESKENLGFSGGNNMAISKAKGEYLVLLNPDTLVQEDTFKTLLSFFDKTEDASAATCKILNPDGTFSIDCRHSIPTPSIAFWKVLGLSKIFPKSKIFGKYNLTYLDENKTYEVEAISGSFMMIKREMIEKIGLLDDSFFMYCEDIDYCRRINQAGGKIYYVPDTQIVHYKGESSKANNLDYVITFNRSLYKFYKKHYQQKYLSPFKLLILLGVILRGILIYSRNWLKQYFPMLLDLAILNLTLFFSFWYRYELKHRFHIDDFLYHYIIINIITSIAYIVSALFFDLVRKGRFYRDKVFKVLISTFLFVAALTAFFKQFAFSRFVVLLASIASTVLMIGWRVIFTKYASKYNSVLDREFLRKKCLIVGDSDDTRSLLQKLNERLESGLDVVGIVSKDKSKINSSIEGFPIVTSMDQLEEYVRIKKIDVIIFSTQNIPFENILTTMTNLQGKQVEYKMVPGHLEFMIGKSNVERLEDVSLVDIEYDYGKIYNRFIKRCFDFFLSTLILVFCIPVLVFAVVFLRKKLRYIKVRVGNKYYKVTSSANSFLNFCFVIHNIWSGKMSFVGAPLNEQTSRYEYKPGLTGIIQINKEKLEKTQNYKNYEIQYLKNQSFFIDIEILISSLLKKKNKP